jgi:hypothetical protein
MSSHARALGRRRRRPVLLARNRRALLLALGVFPLGRGQLRDLEGLLCARMCVHMCQEADAPLVLFGGRAHHLDLLFGGEVFVRARHGGHCRLFVQQALWRRCDGQVGGEEVFVRQVRAGGGLLGLGAEERGSVGPGGECTRRAHAHGAGEGGFARGDVQEPVVGRGRRWWWRR